MNPTLHFTLQKWEKVQPLPESVHFEQGKESWAFTKFRGTMSGGNNQRDQLL
jgi:hypothetical protein